MTGCAFRLVSTQRLRDFPPLRTVLRWCHKRGAARRPSAPRTRQRRRLQRKQRSESALHQTLAPTQTPPRGARSLRRAADVPDPSRRPRRMLRAGQRKSAPTRARAHAQNRMRIHPSRMQRTIRVPVTAATDQNPHPNASYSPRPARTAARPRPGAAPVRATSAEPRRGLEVRPHGYAWVHVSWC